MLVRAFSSLSKTATAPVPVGKALHDFVVKEIRPIPELGINAIILAHVPSKAQYLHVQANDGNNVFAVGFSTPVWDSKGTPHILEHTTLCGSKAYPVRDPFFKMLNRSLSTYMNAWTGSDFTMYPFASQNVKDYANLRSVYLDAVFNPLLERHDFLQEGWRIEPHDESFQFKGIVFNEMKGVFSSKEAQFHHQITSNLLKGSTYGYESGGIPLEIPNLSYQELVAFHKKHYTLNNCKVFTFGNIPLEEHTEALSKSFASYPVKPFRAAELIKNLEKITTPRRLTVTCPFDKLLGPAEQCMFSISFLGNNTHDAQETFNLQLLSHLLLDGPSAPMFKELIDSNIGHEYSPGTGYDSGCKVGILSIGLQGVSQDSVPLIEQKIFTCLERVKTESFSKERIESVIHQLLLANRYHSSKFGLSLVSTILPTWIRGNDPLEHLMLSKRIELFQKEFNKNENFVANMIDKYFLQNEHRLHLLMVPDESFDDIIVNEEAQKLQSVVKTQPKEQWIEDAGLLLQKQQQKQDTSLLPCLTEADINPMYEASEWKKHKKSTTIEYRNPIECNGLSFSKSFFQIQSLSPSELLMLPITTKVVNDIGIESVPIAEFTEQVKRTAGSLSLGTHFLPAKSGKGYRLWSTVSSHCLDSKLAQTFELALKLGKEPNFSDLGRLETIVNADYSDSKNSIADAGHQYAMSYAASALAPEAYAADLLSGVRQIIYMKELVDRLQRSDLDYSKLSQSVKSLYERSFFDSGNQTHFLITGKEQLNEKLFYFDEFLQQMSNKPNAAVNTVESFDGAPNNTLFELPFNVNYVGAALKTVKFGHPDSFGLKILSKLLKSLYLHPEIREKGGAYGGGCSYSWTTGIFSFYSYRDPNPVGSISTIERCLQWIRSCKLTDQNLLEAKLAVFGELDAPIDFHQRDIGHKLQGISPEEIQQNREQMLNTLLQDVYRCAEQYLGNTKSYAIIGKPQSLTDLNSVTTNGWKIENI